ncbi:DoxX family protein [Nocardia sp. NPDC050710]|uniref:DoxX family protein n=1 Tax=Nocardia sp. NPDC050710 TaxID=3157220 RepID=UPI00340CAD2B
MRVATVDTESVPDRVGAEPSLDAGVQHWNPFVRIAFRFCFVYFGLFCLVYPRIISEFLGLAGRLLPESVPFWLARLWGPLVEWTGEHVFGTDAAAHEDSISGDQTFLWVLLFCILIVAVVATVIWTVLDRRRPNYAALSGWFLLFVRLCLAAEMLAYGLSKAIPNQMPPPALARLLEPYGEFSPMAVLWTQVGVSQPYEILLGTAEVLGGMLLFLPRTTTVGALLSLVCTMQVFVLNMTYDVPAKILAFHLMLLCSMLLAPEARRLANVLVLDRPADRSTRRPLLGTARGNRIAVGLQAALGIWLLVSGVYASWDGYRDHGAGSKEPPLYGIWTVAEFSIDGQQVPAVVTDENRWRRVVFDRQNATVQRMDGTLVPVIAIVDTSAHTIAMVLLPTAPGAQPTPLGAFTFDQPAPDRLAMAGQLNGRSVSIDLQQLDPNTFPLRSRGFHWVQEYPYFR